MAIAALVVAIIAILISGGSLTYVRRSTLTNERSERSSRTPHLTIELADPEIGGGVAYFSLRNDATQDLDSVMIYAADEDAPPGNIVVHPRQVARQSGNFGSTAELGPLRKNAQTAFAINVRAGRTPPLLMQINCRAGKDLWVLHERIEIPPDIADQIF